MVWIWISMLLLVFCFLLLSLSAETKITIFFGKKTSTAERIKYIGTICGAIIILGTLYENSNTNKLALEQNTLTKKSHLDNRFLEANNLLNSESISANIAGVYALHQIAIESSKTKENIGYVPVIKNILCNVIKENSRLEKQNVTERWVVLLPLETIDIDTKEIDDNPNRELFQAIIDVLFKKEESIIYSHHSTSLNNCELQNCDFTNATLINVDFVKSNLQNTNFSRARLQDVKLWGASLQDVKFHYSDLTNVHCYSAHIEGGDFFCANLTNVDFDAANMYRAWFRGAVLKDISFSSAFLNNADFSDVELDSTSFEGGIFYNEYTNFKGTIYENIEKK